MMVWKTELEKRLKIVEEFVVFHKQNAEFGREILYDIRPFAHDAELVSVLRDLIALVPSSHRIDPRMYAEDMCEPLHQRIEKLDYHSKRALDRSSKVLHSAMEEYRKLIESDIAFRDKTHGEKVMALWNLFRRSVKEGSIKPYSTFDQLGEEPTRDQHDALFSYDDGEVCLKRYNSWTSDNFTQKHRWMENLPEAKYKQGQTVYFKTNAPLRRGRTYYSYGLGAIEKAERKLVAEKDAGTLTNKPALIIEVPEIVPEGDYKGNRLYKVMLVGYPAPVLLPERCFKKSTSTRGRKKNA